MEIFLVFGECYGDDVEVIDVFSSEEEAFKCRKRIEKKDLYDEVWVSIRNVKEKDEE